MNAHSLGIGNQGVSNGSFNNGATTGGAVGGSGEISTNIVTSCIVTPPPISKSPLSSHLPPEIIMTYSQNYSQPNSPNLHSNNNEESINLNSAMSGDENQHQPQISSGESAKGRLIENEKVLEYGGPNNRYAKLNVILGKGAYKVVWKALDREEGIECAWNVLQTTKNEFNELSQEIEILTKVRHPNVINFHDSWYVDGEFIFITELMTSGTLREYITKFKNPSIKIIKRWARQILKGMAYLHSHNPPIIHRDIKCDNIFVNGSHGEIKIGDMGTAKMKIGKKYTVIGTPEFMAPEMYEEKGYSEKVDIYAFGMCFLEMTTGEYPYSECKNAAQIYKKVTQGIRPECISKVEDKEAQSIINICLSNENDRWSAKKLLDFFFSEDPEVVLISIDENKVKLHMQVAFKGAEKPSVKFDFNINRDTPEIIVQEMIQEGILPPKYQTLMISEINKILREVNSKQQLDSIRDVLSPPPVPPFSEKNLHYFVVSQNHATNNSPSANGNNHVVFKKDGLENQLNRLSITSSENNVIGKEKGDVEPMTRDFADHVAIGEFISEVATLYNRGIDKATEWLRILKMEDIDSVGDLRKLQEEDWTRLNLTVFASRAMKNALNGKSKNSLLLSSLSPRVTGRISDSTTTTTSD